MNNSVTLDPYGGVEGELDLPADASLGVWQLNIANMGGGTFRVEEYRAGVRSHRRRAGRAGDAR